MLNLGSGASLRAVLTAVRLVWDMHGYSRFRVAALAACRCSQPSSGTMCIEQCGSIVLDCSDSKLQGHLEMGIVNLITVLLAGKQLYANTTYYVCMH